MTNFCIGFLTAFAIVFVALRLVRYFEMMD